MSFVEGTTLTGPIRPLLAFAQHARTLPDQPIAQHMIVTTARSDSNDFIATARAQGLPITVLPERRAFDPAVARSLQLLLEEQRPDVIETHNFKPHFLLALLRPRLRRRSRWLAFHHGYTTESLRVRCYNQLDRYSLRRADHVITLCQPFADELIHTRGVAASRISIIKNAAEPPPEASAAELAALRAELGIAIHERVVLSVGRLSAEKNHAGLISAFATLHSQPEFADVRLLLVGDGPERLALQAQATVLGKAILLVGQRRDVHRFYRLAQVFVLPSFSEGSPLVLLEALQAGCPIVATAVGGIPETVVADESALLIPSPPQPVALAAAIARLLRDAGLCRRLVVAGTATLRRYTPAAYADNLLKIYRQDR